MFLEILARSNWKRPVYVAISVGGAEYLNLDKYLVQEGLAYRITPFNWDAMRRAKLAEQYPNEDISKIPFEAEIDTDKMYTNLMTKFKFGGMDSKGVYIDENAMRMCLTHRRTIVQLAEALVEEGDSVRAHEVLDFAQKNIPNENVPYDFQSYSHIMAETYYRLNDSEHGDEIVKVLADHSLAYVDWSLTLSDKQIPNVLSLLGQHFSMLRSAISMMVQYDSKYADEYIDKQKAFAQTLDARIKLLNSKK